MGLVNTDAIRALSPSYFVKEVCLGSSMEYDGQICFLSATAPYTISFKSSSPSQDFTYLLPKDVPASDEATLTSLTNGQLGWGPPLSLYATIDLPFVTIGNPAALSAERALTGTTNQITITDNGAGTTVTLSLPQNIHTGATPTFAALTLTNTSNQLVLGVTRTVTVTAPTPLGSSRTHTVPDISGNGTFAFLEGTQTFSGSKTFSSAVTINPTSNQIVLGVTNTITLTAPSPAASRTYTIPDISGNGSFALLEGTQTFSGTKTFSASTTFSLSGLAVDLTNTSDAQTRLRVFVNSNTSSARATLALITGGSSSNDSDINFSVNGVQDWTIGLDNSDSDKFKISGARTLGTTDRFTITTSGSVVLNSAAIATNATDGFLYIPTCAGTPTGTPTTFTGRVPLVYDTTNNKFYIYSGGLWLGGTAPGAWS